MLDISKHAEVFNPNWVQGQIAIVGVGALGSALALNLGKLGLGSKMALFDEDNVESHNVANQYLYGMADIGVPKVSAASAMIERLTTNSARDAPASLCFNVTKRSDLEDMRYVFVCVDSMKARKEIFEKCVFMNPDIHYFGEGRMNAREGMAYGFNPLDMNKSMEYINRMYSDDDVKPNSGGCSITQSIGATAMTLACQMTWQFMDTLSGDPKRKPPEEIALQVPNLAVHSKGMLS